MEDGDIRYDDDDNQYDRMCEQSFDDLQGRVEALKNYMVKSGGLYYAKSEERVLKDMYYIIKGIVQQYNKKLKDSGAGHRVGCGGIICSGHPDYEKADEGI